jgi:hypothetical protein
MTSSIKNVGKFGLIIKTGENKMFKSTYEDILNDEIQNVATFG